MSNKDRLEKAYRELQNSQIPDLWQRIEANLDQKDGGAVRDRAMEERTADCGENGGRRPAVSSKKAWRREITAAAAGVCVLFTAAAFTLAGRVEKKTEEGFSGPAHMAEETAAGSAPAPEYDTARAGGALRYEELRVTGAEAGLPPQNAVYIPEDSAYFTEDILAGSELLCLARVQNVSYEPDGDGIVREAAYDIAVDRVLYSGDAGHGELQTIRVYSPLVEDGEGRPLYLMKNGGRYVLPLHKDGGRWNLSFACAPQIEATEDGGYVFHTGWQRLADDNAVVVKAERQSPEDFYYDRMLYRDDDQFLPSLIEMAEALRGVRQG